MKYRRAPIAAWRTIAGETVVLNLETKQVYGLNESGGLIWSAVADATDVEQLSEFLSSSGASLTANTVAEFCSELLRLGLLARVGADPESGLARDPRHGPQRPELDHPELESLPAPPPPESLDPPAVVWQEPLQQPGGTCAFLPAGGPLCIQAPFS